MWGITWCGRPNWRTLQKEEEEGERKQPLVSQRVFLKWNMHPRDCSLDSSSSDKIQTVNKLHRRGPLQNWLDSWTMVVQEEKHSFNRTKKQGITGRKLPIQNSCEERKRTGKDKVKEKFPSLSMCEKLTNAQEENDGILMMPLGSRMSTSKKWEQKLNTGTKLLQVFYMWGRSGMLISPPVAHSVTMESFLSWELFGKGRVWGI